MRTNVMCKETEFAVIPILVAIAPLARRESMVGVIMESRIVNGKDMK